MMPVIKQNQLLRILVIEDDRLLQMIHENVLTRMGFNVVVVDHPQKAIELWSEHWDIIFSDIGLPGISGIELCKLRRQYEEEKGLPRTPAFAYSAFGPTIKNECLTAGFDGFGDKPMPHEKLYEELQKLLPQFDLVAPKSFDK